MTYDEKCADLARVFLSDINAADDKNVDLLAQDIQRAIEDFMREIEETRAALDPFTREKTQ